MKKIVIIGGGFSGSLIARKLENSFDVTLVDSKDYFEYTPGVLRTIIFPPHARKIECLHENYLKKAHFINGFVKTISKKNVLVNGKKLSYDYLVICTGSSYIPPIREENVIIADHIHHLENKHNELEKSKKILIIGGGLVGVELAAEICTAYKDKEITIIHAMDRLIERNPEKASKYAQKFLENEGVKIIFNEFFKGKEKDYFITDKGTKISADIILACIGIHSNSEFMLKYFNEALNEKKQIKVDEYLNVAGTRNIFAAGDVNDTPVEKTAQNARKQAKTAIKNIYATENEKELRKYKSKITPMVISLGKWNGLFIWKNFIIEGLIPGMLKTIIERKNMRKYR